MLQAFSTSHNRAVTLMLFGVCCVCGIAASSAGVADNPPAIVLALAAASALILGFAHPWRSEAPFRALFYASVLSLIGLVLLDGLVEVYLRRWILEQGAGFRSAFERLWEMLFVLVVMLFPPALVIGLGGWIAMSVRNRHGVQTHHNTRSPQ